MLKAGEIFHIDTGEYSDYEVAYIGYVTKDFDMEEMHRTWEMSPCSKDSWENPFWSWLDKQGVCEEISPRSYHVPWWNNVPPDIKCEPFNPELHQLWVKASDK